MIPYSVSMPQTLRMATTAPYPRARRAQGPREPRLEVLAGGDALDGTTAACLLVRRDERAHIDDPLALLAGDLGPVVGVRRVRQVLVLLVLLMDRGDEVLRPDALGLAADVALDGELLRAPHDVLDHGPGREVLEVHDLLVTVLVGDLEEPVLLVRPVHLLDRLLDHRR